VRVPEIKLWAGEADGVPGLTREFLIADVFTGAALEGNQLGIFTDGRGLGDELMLKATREMNFSETVFFLPPAAGDEADAHVRIFTPGGEIPFAGHPTLGSAWVLGAILGKQAVRIRTAAGLVPVELERAGETIKFGWMSQPIPTWAPCDRAAELIDALGAGPKQGGLPVETYTNGPVNVYVEFPDEDAVAALDPDMQRLGKIPLNVSCFAQAGTGWITRMFAPALGVIEDPATGSAAGPLAVHLARHGRISFGEEIVIRQGEQIRRPSVLYARAEGTPEAISEVVVGGQAVVVARGEYQLG
jgi:trans-2,3-dihydro-3-hydroxyanthranilate isomerase